MSQDNSAAPLAHFDEGEPIWVVLDKDGRSLSINRTEEGAKAADEGYGGNNEIIPMSLYR